MKKKPFPTLICILCILALASGFGAGYYVASNKDIRVFCQGNIIIPGFPS